MSAHAALERLQACLYSNSVNNSRSSIKILILRDGMVSMLRVLAVGAVAVVLEGAFIVVLATRSEKKQ